MILMIVALFFLSAFLGLITLYMWYAAMKASPAFEIKRRLRKIALETDKELPEDVKIEILFEMTPVDRFLYKFKLIRELHGFIDKAGLKIDAKIFFLILLSSAAAGFIIGIALKRGMIFPALFTIIGVLIPLLYLNFRTARRVQQFSDQFANVLDMISRSLRAGHSFASAVQVVGDEMSEPVAGLFKTAYEEQTFGLSMREALSHMTERMDTVDLRYFVTAVNIYREIGGNLSEILERLAFTIRERLKIQRQVKVYTAQARLTGHILAVIPIVVAVVLYMLDPEYIGELLTNKIGRYLIAGAITGQIIGYFVIRKIIDIRI